MALTIPNRFANAQTIDAAKFNSNFDAIVTWATLSEASVDAVEASVTTANTAMAKIGQGAFSARKETNITLTTTTYTTIECSDTLTDTFDTDGWYLKSSGVYTPLVAGSYSFSFIASMLTAGFDAGESVNFYITKNTSRYLLFTLTSGLAQGGCGTLLLNANGSSDTFKIEAYASAECVIDFTHFSGFCVHPS